jgi:hypothetical protein
MGHSDPFRDVSLAQKAAICRHFSCRRRDSNPLLGVQSRYDCSLGVLDWAAQMGVRPRWSQGRGRGEALQAVRERGGTADRRLHVSGASAACRSSRDGSTRPARRTVRSYLIAQHEGMSERNISRRRRRGESWPITAAQSPLPATVRLQIVAQLRSAADRDSRENATRRLEPSARRCAPLPSRESASGGFRPPVPGVPARCRGGAYAACSLWRAA